MAVAYALVRTNSNGKDNHHPQNTFAVGADVTGDRLYAIASNGHAVGPRSLQRKNGFIAYLGHDVAGANPEGHRVFVLSYDTGDLIQAYGSGPLGVAHVRLAQAHVEAEADRDFLLAIPTDISDPNAIPDEWVAIAS